MAEAIKNKNIYRHIWDGAKREIIAKYGKDHEVVKTLTAFFETNIGTPYDASQLERGLNQGMKAEDIKLSELVRKHYTVVDATRAQPGRETRRRSGLKRGRCSGPGQKDSGPNEDHNSNKKGEDSRKHYKRKG